MDRKISKFALFALFLLAASLFSGCLDTNAPTRDKINSFKSVPKIALFSSRGPVLPGYTLKPDVLAPGVGICAPRSSGTYMGSFTCGSDYYVAASGTSMATPFVAGAAAVLKQRHPNWTSQQIRSALSNTADKVDYSAFEQGAGAINLFKAVDPQLLFSPSALSLAANRSTTLTVANPSSGRRLVVFPSSVNAYNIEAEDSSFSITPANLPLHFSSNNFCLEPGQSQTVEVSFNTNLTPYGVYYFDLGPVAYDGCSASNSVGQARFSVPASFYKKRVLNVTFIRITGKWRETNIYASLFDESATFLGGHNFDFWGFDENNASIWAEFLVSPPKIQVDARFIDFQRTSNETIAGVSFLSASVDFGDSDYASLVIDESSSTIFQAGALEKTRQLGLEPEEIFTYFYRPCHKTGFCGASFDISGDIDDFVLRASVPSGKKFFLQHYVLGTEPEGPRLFFENFSVLPVELASPFKDFSIPENEIRTVEYELNAPDSEAAKSRDMRFFVVPYDPRWEGFAALNLFAIPGIKRFTIRDAPGCNLCNYWEKQATKAEFWTTGRHLSRYTMNGDPTGLYNDSSRLWPAGPGIRSASVFSQPTILIISPQCQSGSCMGIANHTRFFNYPALFGQSTSRDDSETFYDNYWNDASLKIVFPSGATAWAPSTSYWNIFCADNQMNWNFGYGSFGMSVEYANNSWGPASCEEGVYSFDWSIRGLNDETPCTSLVASYSNSSGFSVLSRLNGHLSGGACVADTPSALVNKGNYNLKGLLQISLEKLVDGYWLPSQTIFNNSLPFPLAPGKSLPLLDLWKNYGPVHVPEPGTYRVAAQFTDSRGKGQVFDTQKFKVIPSPVPLFCYDSDKGLMYDKKGLTYNATHNSTDYCLDEFRLREYYCDYDYYSVKSVDWKCDFGCFNGECNQTPPEPPLPTPGPEPTPSPSPSPPPLPTPEPPASPNETGYLARTYINDNLDGYADSARTVSTSYDGTDNGAYFPKVRALNKSHTGLLALPNNGAIPNPKSVDVKEKQWLLLHSQTRFDSSAGQVVAENPRGSYMTLFEPGLPLCWDWKYTSNYSVCSFSSRLENTHTQIWLLGSQWVVDSYGPTDGSSLEFVTLGKETGYNPYMRVGDNITASNGALIVLKSILPAGTYGNSTGKASFEVTSPSGITTTETVDEGSKRQVAGITIKVYKAGADSADVSVYSDELALGEKQELGSDHKYWYARIGSGYYGSSQSIRALFLYSTRFGFDDASKKLLPGESASFIRGEPWIDFSYAGLEESSKDQLSFATAGTVTTAATLYTNGTSNYIKGRFVVVQSGISNAFQPAGYDSVGNVYILIVNSSNGKPGLKDNTTPGAIYFRDSSTGDYVFYSHAIDYYYSPSEAAVLSSAPATGGRVVLLQEFTTDNEQQGYAKNVGLFVLTSLNGQPAFQFSNGPGSSTANKFYYDTASCEGSCSDLVPSLLVDAGYVTDRGNILASISNVSATIEYVSKPSRALYSLLPAS